jgi:hypothetical protein
MVIDQVEFECPLLMRVIDEGYCYEINSDIEGLSALGTGMAASRESGRPIDGMKLVCQACPHYPF